MANPAYGKSGLSEEVFSRFWLNAEKGVLVASEPTEDFYEKKPIKEKHSFIRFAKKYVWPFRLEMFQSALGMLFGILLSMITPFLTQAMVDDGVGMRNMNIILSIMLAQLLIFFGFFFDEFDK